MMNEKEIMRILQKHKEHLRECRRTDESLYWVGALDCVDNLAVELGIDLE